MAKMTVAQYREMIELQKNSQEKRLAKMLQNAADDLERRAQYMRQSIERMANSPEAAFCDPAGLAIGELMNAASIATQNMQQIATLQKELSESKAQLEALRMVEQLTAE